MTQHMDYMQKEKKATLILDDGTVFRGISFGADKNIAGEVVFNTARIPGKFDRSLLCRSVDGLDLSVGRQLWSTSTHLQ